MTLNPGSPFLLHCPRLVNAPGFCCNRPPAPQTSMTATWLDLCFVLLSGSLSFCEPQFSSLKNGEESGLSGFTRNRSGVDCFGVQAEKGWPAPGDTCILLASWDTTCIY